MSDIDPYGVLDDIENEVADIATLEDPLDRLAEYEAALDPLNDLASQVSCLIDDVERAIAKTQNEIDDDENDDDGEPITLGPHAGTNP